MPDDALQRLRRAQYPGHRRQAHPAHPQRHGHRYRRRRLGHARPTQLNHLFNATSAARTCLRRRSPPTRRGGSLTSGCRASPTSSPPSRSPSSSVTGRRCDRDGGDRRRRALRQRGRVSARRYRGGFDEVKAGEIFGRYLRGAAEDNVLELDRPSARGYSTWATTRGSSSRASRSTSSNRGGTSASGGAWSRAFRRGIASSTSSMPMSASTSAQQVARVRTGDPLMTVAAVRDAQENLARRDRSLREKVMSLEEAVSFVRDGDCRRHRRQHDVADADGADLGADSRRRGRSCRARGAIVRVTAICCSPRASAITS